MYRYIWKIKLHNPKKHQEFIDFWHQVSDILQTYPGASGSHAHKLRGEEGSYFMMAEWESQAHRDAMSKDIHEGDSHSAKKWRALPSIDSFGENTIFAGEEIDQVFPKVQN
jgi:quinol monooxygenase YgiN